MIRENPASRGRKEKTTAEVLVAHLLERRSTAVVLTRFTLAPGAPCEIGVKRTDATRFSTQTNAVVSIQTCVTAALFSLQTHARAHTRTPVGAHETSMAMIFLSF